MTERFRTLDSPATSPGQTRSAARRPQRADGGWQGERRDAHRARWLPTIRELADKGARVVVMSHFGRPKGEPDPPFRCARWPAPSPRRGRPSLSPRIASARAAQVVAAHEAGEVRCWKICASTRRKRRTIRVSRARSPRSAISMSTTPSPPPIARTPRPRRGASAAGRGRPADAGASSRRWRSALETPHARWRRSSAAPRCRPSSTSSPSHRQGRRADHRRRHGEYAALRARHRVGTSLCERDMAETARGLIEPRAQGEAAASAAGRCGGAPGAQGRHARVALRRRRPRAAGRDDPRHRPEAIARVADALGRAARWCGTDRSAPSRRRPSTPARCLARPRPRSPTTASCSAVAGGGDTVAALAAGRRVGRVHLCLDRGRRLPRMDRRQGAAGGRRAARLARSRGCDDGRDCQNRVRSDGRAGLPARSAVRRRRGCSKTVADLNKSTYAALLRQGVDAMKAKRPTEAIDIFERISTNTYKGAYGGAVQ